jgi:hypothetical protein
MKQIEKQMLAAVKERRNWRSGNTEVSVRTDIYGCSHIEVRLHDNLIFKQNDAEDSAEFTLAGWNTNTTRSRLRALGVDVCQKDYRAYYKNRFIYKTDWYSCDTIK